MSPADYLLVRSPGARKPGLPPNRAYHRKGTPLRDSDSLLAEPPLPSPGNIEGEIRLVDGEAYRAVIVTTLREHQLQIVNAHLMADSHWDSDLDLMTCYGTSARHSESLDVWLRRPLLREAPPRRGESGPSA